MLYFQESLMLYLNNDIKNDVVYFDFPKAFDSVNHDILLTKLKHEYGIIGTLLKFLVDYLQNRQQCVVIGCHQSEHMPVASGVPQGYILGPLLFVMFINDMFDCISDKTNIALYADDTKIWREIIVWDDHLALQNDIDNLLRWATGTKGFRGMYETAKFPILRDKSRFFTFSATDREISHSPRQIAIFSVLREKSRIFL